MGTGIDVCKEKSWAIFAAQIAQKSEAVLILLSTWNGNKYLSEQLDSIFSQTIAEDIFVFARDDGSTDGTQDILDKYASSGRLYWYQGENVGAARSFHKLMREAPTAVYYAFADQDDVWLSNKVEKARRAIAAETVPALFSSSKQIVDENLQLMSVPDAKPVSLTAMSMILHTNVLSGCTMLFNDAMRRIYLQAQWEQLPFAIGCWHDAWLARLASIFGKIIYLDEPDILYRQHGDNSIGVMTSGMALLIRRISTLDFTLKKYRENDFSSRTAKSIEEIYQGAIPVVAAEIVHNIAYARTSLVSRLKLFWTSGLSRKPLYEFLVYKLWILLGWI